MVLSTFTGGNVVIYRVGDGTNSLSNNGSAVYLDEYSPTGALIQSIQMPTTPNAQNHPLIAAGQNSGEGLLTLSGDGRYLFLTGYDELLSRSSPLPNSSVRHTIGRVDANGLINTTTALGDFADDGVPRGAYSIDGNEIWATGSTDGVRFFKLGDGNSKGLTDENVPVRGVTVYNGQLYVSAGAGSFRIAGVGTGTPKDNLQPFNSLPGTANTLTSPYQFFFIDTRPDVAGGDTLYVADEAQGIRKFSLVSGNWVDNGTIGTAGDSYRGLTGFISDSKEQVTLYATRNGGADADGGGELVRIVDNSGYNHTIRATPTLVATAGNNTAFRGVALAPNFAPVLTGANNFASKDEGSDFGNGTLVSDLIAGKVTDGNTALGIAVTGITGTAGRWEYSVDGGNDWDNLVEVSESKALLLKADANTRIRFNADPNVSGSENGITFRAWDQSSGIADTEVSTVNNGVGTAFSAATATAFITVNPIADTPSVSATTATEDQQTTSGLVVSRNANDGAEVTHFKITDITNGTLFKNDGVTQVTNDSFLTYDEAHAGLKFTPAANFAGTASFKVQASVSNTDAGLGGSVVTRTIAVTAAADAPVVTVQNATGLVNTPIELNISAIAPDTDSEIVTVEIDGVPADATFNKGVKGSGGKWSFNQSDLSGLTIAMPTSATVNLTVTATSMESSNNDTATTARTLTITARVRQQHLTAVGAVPGTSSMVTVYNADGSVRGSIMAFAPNFQGGVSVATGDVNGDRIDDIGVAAGAGGGPHVRIFDGASMGEIASFYAYGMNITGGVSIAMGDVNGDGLMDVITGAGPGGGPHVRVWSMAGGGLTEIASFYAYDPSYTGGVNVASTDLDGDGNWDIITGTMAGFSPHVKAFSGRDFSEIGSFFAYDEGYTGGAWVAGGDADGDGKGEIFTAAYSDGAVDLRGFGGPGFGLKTSGMATLAGGSTGVRVKGVRGADGKADLLLSTVGVDAPARLFDGITLGELDATFVAGL